MKEHQPHSSDPARVKAAGPSSDRFLTVAAPMRIRRATIYVPLLILSVLVSVIGLSALTATRIESKGTIERGDLLEARSLASSAIELGLQRIESDPNWRDVHPNGNWFSNVALGGGAFSLDGTDGDGLPLNNNTSDNLVLLGIGSFGRARFKLEVTLVSQSGGINSLQSSLHAGFGLSFSSTTVSGSNFISSNTSIWATTSNVYPDAQAATTLSGSTYHGLSQSGAGTWEMPDSTVAFDPYIAEGTVIDISSIPLSGGFRTVSNKLFGPTANPFGPQTNVKGIYVIECKGQIIRLSRVRVQGTLVLLDAPPFSNITAEHHWTSELPNYPVLMVRGFMHFDLSGSALSESSAGTNFNPPGTPYLGVSDADTTDTYPAKLKGLVYVSGNASAAGTLPIEGAMIIGGMFSGQSSSQIQLTHNSIHYTNPPPGFMRQPFMAISPGSWVQATDAYVPPGIDE